MKIIGKFWMDYYTVWPCMLKPNLTIYMKAYYVNHESFASSVIHKSEQVLYFISLNETCISRETLVKTLNEWIKSPEPQSHPHPGLCWSCCLTKTLLSCVDANKYCANGSKSCFEGQLYSGKKKNKKTSHYHAYLKIFFLVFLATQTVGFKCAFCFKCEKCYRFSAPVYSLCEVPLNWH